MHDAQVGGGRDSPSAEPAARVQSQLEVAEVRGGGGGGGSSGNGTTLQDQIDDVLRQGRSSVIEQALRDAPQESDGGVHLAIDSETGVAPECANSLHV